MIPKARAPRKPRLFLMALFGKERVPRSYPKRKHETVLETAKEWWKVQAMTAAHARAVCLAWPKASMDPITEARILDHSRRK